MTDNIIPEIGAHAHPVPDLVASAAKLRKTRDDNHAKIAPALAKAREAKAAFEDAVNSDKDPLPHYREWRNSVAAVKDAVSERDRANQHRIWLLDAASGKLFNEPRRYIHAVTPSRTDDGYESEIEQRWVKECALYQDEVGSDSPKPTRFEEAHMLTTTPRHLNEYQPYNLMGVPEPSDYSDEITRTVNESLNAKV